MSMVIHNILKLNGLGFWEDFNLAARYLVIFKHPRSLTDGLQKIALLKRLSLIQAFEPDKKFDLGSLKKEPFG